MGKRSSVQKTYGFDASLQAYAYESLPCKYYYRCPILQKLRLFHSVYMVDPPPFEIDGNLAFPHSFAPLRLCHWMYYAIRYIVHATPTRAGDWLPVIQCTMLYHAKPCHSNPCR